MKINEIKEIAERQGLKAGKMNKTDLVRAIQRSENNNDCFNTGTAAVCGQSNCLWMEDCK
ncbi:SAP domain-containing protein [Geomesophilobacter sediminis]|uniref:SAP domain-containing protein n=1 Tax=Geomesophilobacter sediminis TaxID=2798584 RepID=A0A8J7JCC5_9BACT|nr:SAP domain-containing protein [Geomesophilobacter sediminis]MBJ6724418.1 SAP domain-containing protein [Geomesophilobacter sediminis]